MERDLVNNLEILLNFLNNLRKQFEALVESYDRACDHDLLQESYSQTICAPEISDTTSTTMFMKY